MKISLTSSKNIYHSDTDAGLDISIPMLFNGAQPNTYGVPPASAQAYRDGSFVGDTREGGSCNFETYTLTPHCNGTHTEGIGHLTRARVQIALNPSESFIPACLLSAQPQSPAETKDTYTPALNPEDLVITLASIQDALSGIKDWRDCPAIIIRTLPNLADKKSRNYMEQSPAFFSHEAMRFLASENFVHLLTDLPSLDRLFDEGLLSNHRIWWNLPSADASLDARYTHRTVTEMIFAPDTIPDGIYLLNLQIAPFVGDASPSRPVLFPLIQS